MSRQVSYLLILVLASGCTFKLPQYEVVKGMLSSDATDIGASAAWLAKANGSGAILKAYSAEGLTVFANKDGDAIAFDGWSIRSIIGFGLASPLTIAINADSNVLTYNGSSIRVQCQPWTQPKQGNNVMWAQVCSNGSKLITLNPAGEITLIQAPLGETLGSVEIRLMND